MAHPSNPEAHPDGIEISKLVPFSLKSGVVYCNFWDFSGLPIYVCPSRNLVVCILGANFLVINPLILPHRAYSVCFGL